jgi:hypothetical protein
MGRYVTPYKFSRLTADCPAALDVAPITMSRKNRRSRLRME